MSKDSSNDNKTCIDINIVKKMQENDLNLMREQSNQALTLVNIIDAYTVENNKLKEHMEVTDSLQNNSCDKLDQCEENKCDLKYFFNIQCILFFMLFLLFIYLFIIYTVTS